MPDRTPLLPEHAPLSLVEVLDRLLDTGIVADGQIVLTVAGVDLVYLGVRALVASVDSARRMCIVPTNPGAPCT
jgi:hypothetical protein